MKTLQILALIFAALFFSHAQAYDLTTSPYLTGDWGGTRTDLSNKGMNFVLAYGGESAHNYTGGSQQLTEYTDQIVIGANFDFEKMGWWKGGSASVIVTDRNGENLGSDANIGNDMLIQEVYGRGQTWHTTSFWYNQKFFDNYLEWKLGRMTVGEDFASFSCDFQNLTFCGAQPGNLVGSYWINWPTSVWATRVKLNSTKETNWQIGAYQVNPIYVQNTYAQSLGFSLDNPNGSTGTLVPAEFGWFPKVQGMPGSYKFGGWWNTVQSTNYWSTTSYGSQYGFYVNFMQQVTGDSSGTPNLSVFFNATQANPQTAAVDRQISLGAQYNGPFGRAKDGIGLGLGMTDNNALYASYVQQTTNLIIANGTEYASELYYSYAPVPSIFLRPNLQEIVYPGGNTANQNAFILGLKLGVTL